MVISVWMLSLFVGLFVFGWALGHRGGRRRSQTDQEMQILAGIKTGESASIHRSSMLYGPQSLHVSKFKDCDGDDGDLVSDGDPLGLSRSADYENN